MGNAAIEKYFITQKLVNHNLKKEIKQEGNLIYIYTQFYSTMVQLKAIIRGQNYRDIPYLRKTENRQEAATPLYKYDSSRRDVYYSYEQLHKPTVFIVMLR